MLREGVVCLLFSLASVSAQTPTGVVVGSVTDPTGAAVPNARIELTNEQTGLKRDAVSDTAGAFRVPDLPAGDYGLAVEVQGFKRYQQSGITLTVNRNVTVNAVLQVGNVSESVTVTTAPPQVDTVSGALSSVVGPREAKELPLNGRNVLQLMSLNPGLASWDTFNSVTGNTSYSVNGARGDQVNFLLDGATNNDDNGNVSNYFPSPDAVQEFSLLTNNFSAEYGMGAGGIVNAVSKSGTNRLHASAFEFVRNTVLNSADFFSHQKDTLKRNQYGATAGGPVYIPRVYNGRDKTFFFYSYQDTALRFAPTTRTSTVPTAAERSGDFSQSALGTPIDPLTGQPFPNKQIPAARFDPSVVKMLDALVPLPNAGGNILRFGARSLADSYEHLVKIDHSLSTKDKLSGRFFMFNTVSPPTHPTPTPTGVNIFTSANGTINRSVNAVLSDSHIFSPTLLNNLTLNFNRLKNTSQAGYPEKTPCDFGRIMYCFPSGLRFTTTQFSFPGQTTTIAPRESFRLADGVNWIRGRHNLKLGLDLRQVRSDYSSDSSANGIPRFTGQVTGNVFADVMLGLEYSDGRISPSAINERGFFQSYYAHDDIRLSSRFSINAGVRWDPFTPLVEKSDRLSRFDPTGYYKGPKSQRFVNAPPGLYFIGDKLPDGSTLSRATIPNDLKMFAPRFGFAYNPFGNARTAIRGGYGVFYDQQVVPELLNRQKNSLPFTLSYFVYGQQFRNIYKGPDPFAALSIPPKPDVQFLLPPGYVSSPGPNFRPAYIQQWNLTVEQQLMRDLLLRLSYVGTKGNRLEVSRNINAAVYIPGNSTIANTDARRPFAPQYAAITLNGSDGLSIYHALQVTLERRFNHGVQFNVNYSWARSIDMGSRTLEGSDNACSCTDVPQNPNNLRADRGPSGFDVHHRFVASGIWDIPAPGWKSPIAKALLKGWELSPIITMQTGTPLTVLTGQDRSFTANGFDRPDVIGNPVLSNSRPKQDKIARYFDPGVFVLNQIGQFGNLGRDAIRGPGFVNVDAGLFKNFRFKESGNVQFRWEMFNALNHANLGTPITTMGLNLGRILSDRGPRIMQLSLKLQF